MKKIIITWRKATDEEIEKGLDSIDNKGMIEEDRTEIEVDEEPNLLTIDLNDVEQLTALKEALSKL